MGTYVSIPTEIEAVQWTGDNADEIKELGGPGVLRDMPEGMIELFVSANKAWLEIEIGEWVILDHVGCYPCMDHLFKFLYKEKD